MASPLRDEGTDGTDGSDGVGRIDGRRARRHRSRDLAVDALLDLLNDGVLRPTAQQVAERSGVSLRSIFRIFDDVQSLHEAATARHLERVGHLFVAIDASGSLDDRLDAVLDVLTQLYEEVAPVRRAALRLAPESAVFAERTAQARSWLRAQVDRVFAPELAPAAGEVAVSPSASETEAEGGSGDRQLSLRAAALEAALSFEAWDQLRLGQRLSPAEARAVTAHAARRLLT